jgi:hypothetical protein
LLQCSDMGTIGAVPNWRSKHGLIKQYSMLVKQQSVVSIGNDACAFCPRSRPIPPGEAAAGGQEAYICLGVLASRATSPEAYHEPRRTVAMMTTSLASSHAPQRGGFLFALFPSV